MYFSEKVRLSSTSLSLMKLIGALNSFLVTVVLELDGASPVGKQRDHLMCFVEQIAIGY